MSKKGGTRGGITRRMWLAVEMAWLGLGGPILTFIAKMWLENPTLTL